MSDLTSLSTEQLLALRQQAVANGAINQNESNGAPDSAAGIVNPVSGARGNMQVEPSTAASPGYGVTPSNGTPEDDARMGRDYRGALQKHYGDEETAAIAYNWGPGNTDNWIANGRNLAKLPTETLKYLKNYKQYQADNAVQLAQPQGAPQAFGGSAPPDQPAAPQPSLTDQFLRQLGLTGRAIGHGVGDAAGALTQGFTRMMGVPDVRGVINNAVDSVTPQPQGGIENAVQGVGATLANPLNYIPGVAGGGIARSALGGAVAAGMQPTDQGITPAQLAGNVAAGAATGGALRGAGRVVEGMNIRPAAQALIDQGVHVTPGQAVGGVVNDIEQKATSIPVLGQTIKGARSDAVSDFNRAIGNQVLAPIGQAAPTSTGRQFVEDVGNRISDQYNQILPHVTFRIDPQMAQDMRPIMQQVRQLPPDTQNAFMNIWQRNFGSQLTPQGTMPGTVFKDADSELGRQAANFRGSSDAFQRQLGGLLQDTQGVMRNSIERTNPNVPTLGPVNAAWRNYTVLRNAGARVNNPDVPIQPGQFQAAVKAGDKTLQKGAYATGNANMQGLSDQGMQVLGANVPDSGTAGRGLLAGFLAGGGGKLALAHPVAATAALAGNAMYSTQAGRAALLAALARRPNELRYMGAGTSILSGPAGAGAAGLLNSSRTQDSQ